MKTKHTSFFSFLTLLLFAVGCGTNVQVTGKVHFEDESPLTAGTVYFENESLSGCGVIDGQGRYRIGTTKENNGLPPGNYTVYIMGAVMEVKPEEPQKNIAATANAAMMGGPSRITKPLIAAKYTSPASSPLKCEVKGKTVFDFKVLPPKKP